MESRSVASFFIASSICHWSSAGYKSTDQLRGKPGVLEIHFQQVHVAEFRLLFVPDTRILNVKMMCFLSSLDETNLVIRHVLGKEMPMANPRRCAPGQAIKNDFGIPLPGLLHQPPFVAALVVLILRSAHVAGL